MDLFQFLCLYLGNFFAKSILMDYFKFMCSLYYIFKIMLIEKKIFEI